MKNFITLIFLGMMLLTSCSKEEVKTGQECPAQLIRIRCGHWTYHKGGHHNWCFPYDKGYDRFIMACGIKPEPFQVNKVHLLYRSVDGRQELATVRES